MADEITTMRLRIEGDVQGVGFRDFASSKANALKLKGWVRNRSGGWVEALVGACMQGPMAARVNNVDLTPDDPPDRLGFTRRPSL
jgi:acylphosphatase